MCHFLLNVCLAIFYPTKALLSNDRSKIILSPSIKQCHMSLSELRATLVIWSVTASMRDLLRNLQGIL